MAYQLLIDVGNSRIKWAMNVDKAFTPVAAVNYRDNIFSEMLDQSFANLPSPDQVVISCVSDAAIQESLTHWIDMHWQLRPRYIVSSEHAGGVANGYREPQALGSDRWAALIAAFEQYGGPVCVVDAGTALTIDILDNDGMHQGGLILPGLHSAQHSLFSNTAMPPVTIIKMPTNQILGHSTQECISLGLQYSLAALFVQLMLQLRQRFGKDPIYLVTGGDAAVIAELLPVTAVHEPHLVLKGLAVLAANT